MLRISVKKIALFELFLVCLEYRSSITEKLLLLHETFCELAIFS